MHAEPARRRPLTRRAALALLVVGVAAASAGSWSPLPAPATAQQTDMAADTAARLANAEARLAAILDRSARMTDLHAIENLQRAYGYYMDKMLWEHVVDLFADDGTMEIGPSGVYVGKDSIRRYLYSLSDGQQGPIEGELYTHMHLQPIITLADDGQSARARWRTLIMTGTYGAGSGGNWGEGPYENEYVKEGGVWKISKLHWFATFIAPYEGGWKNASDEAVEEYSLGRGVEPDRPPSVQYRAYPDVHVPPFHYPHPVTGQ